VHYKERRCQIPKFIACSRRVCAANRYGLNPTTALIYARFYGWFVQRRSDRSNLILCVRAYACVSDFIAINTLSAHMPRCTTFEATNYRYERDCISPIRLDYHDPKSFPPNRVKIIRGNVYRGIISFWLNFNPSILASVHCTDLSILHLPPASVHRKLVNAFKGAVTSKPLRPEQQLLSCCVGC
jgi:hypothetical protein